MAHWTTELPAPATEGSRTHLQDHDALTAALAEARLAIEALAVENSELAARLDLLEQRELPASGEVPEV